MTIYVTDHAVKRFLERVDPEKTFVTAREELERCLAVAKVSDIRRAKTKRTHYIPAPNFIMITSKGSVVTIINRLATGTK